jgi:hypothetical protein
MVSVGVLTREMNMHATAQDVSTRPSSRPVPTRHRVRSHHVTSPGAYNMFISVEASRVCRCLMSDFIQGTVTIICEHVMSNNIT